MSPPPGNRLEDVWRQEAPHVLGALVRRFGGFDACEDAVSEAMIAAMVQWPRDGVPASPRGWLIRVAARRLIDTQRSDRARARREVTDDASTPTPAGEGVPAADDTLRLLLLCCHPALTPVGQVALTLRAVGGLTTAQIAAAFLLPTTTMAQRISRAKAALRAAGASFADPAPEELPARLSTVLHVLYLVFNEGYTPSGGERLVDLSLTDEAIRLARLARAGLPDHPEAGGLLALMLLTQARTAARVDEHGDLLPLDRQDRSQWDQNLIAEGVRIVEDALPRGRVGPYQLQAAIAAVHDEAAAWADTDWLEITMLYRMLDRTAPGPMVTLNLAVAVGMAHGPEAGLAVVDPLLNLPSLQHHHRTHAVRAHLLDRAGRHAEAVQEFTTAARLTTSLPEQRYLTARAAAPPGGAADDQPRRHSR